MPRPHAPTAAGRSSAPVTGGTGRSRRRWAGAVVVVAVASLAAPAAASADHYLGSTLSVAATVAEAFQQDTTFWATALPNPPQGIAVVDRTVVPEDGQIVQFQLRGFAGGDFGPQPVHFQVLRPISGGALKIIATSDLFLLPGTDGVWSFDPTNFCVKKGDRLGFSDEGGFQLAPNGVPFQVFGTESGSQTQYFSKHLGVLNGATITPTPLPPNVELLMAAYEGTGGHASTLCGGTAGVEFHLPQGTAPVGADGSTNLNIGCQGPLPCVGRLALQLPTGQTSAKHKKRKKHKKTPSSLLGSARFAIPSHHTSKVKVRLTPRGRRLLRSHGGHLKVVLAVIGGAGGPANTTTSTLTLSG